MSKGKYAESAQALVGKAFKMAFAKDRSLKKRMRAVCCNVLASAHALLPSPFDE